MVIVKKIQNKNKQTMLYNKLKFIKFLFLKLIVYEPILIKIIYFFSECLFNATHVKCLYRSQEVC